MNECWCIITGSILSQKFSIIRPRWCLDERPLGNSWSCWHGFRYRNCLGTRKQCRNYAHPQVVYYVEIFIGRWSNPRLKTNTRRDKIECIFQILSNKPSGIACPFSSNTVHGPMTYKPWSLAWLLVVVKRLFWHSFIASYRTNDVKPYSARQQSHSWKLLWNILARYYIMSQHYASR